MRIAKLIGRVLLLWLGVWAVAGSVDDRRENNKIGKLTIGAVALTAYVALGEGVGRATIGTHRGRMKFDPAQKFLAPDGSRKS